VSTAAIALENTHNFGGGTVQDLAQVRAVQEFAREHGLAMHLDGARLWNAHIATGVGLADLADGFDTVSVCLSKGLGAPVGSVLAATADRIAQARVWRKRYGAGMRQVGILAAPGCMRLTTTSSASPTTTPARGASRRRSASTRPRCPPTSWCCRCPTRPAWPPRRRPTACASRHSARAWYGW
jgi:hypothetical protein